MKIVYIDGIFDLFHRGHLESLKQAKNIYEDCFLLVGVISDEEAKSYKREPIINEKRQNRDHKIFRYSRQSN